MTLSDQDPEETENAEDMDPSVPTDLLELHMELEKDGMSPEEFKETMG